MDYLTAVRSAFDDELSNIMEQTKLAMGGLSRVGRRPIAAANLLKRGSMVKVSKASTPSPRKVSKLIRYGVPAVGGAVAFDQISKALQDLKTGRMYRQQQGM